MSGDVAVGVPRALYAGRLVIGVEAPADRVHCVERWLGNLVDVLTVDSS